MKKVETTFIMFASLVFLIEVSRVPVQSNSFMGIITIAFLYLSYSSSTIFAVVEAAMNNM